MSAELGPATLVRRNARFDLVEVDGEIILYDKETHGVIYLDRPASVIWLLIDGQRTLADIATLIGDAYPDSRSSVAQDVQRTVSELVAQGAVALEP